MSREITTVVLAERPKTVVVPGETFRVEKVAAPTEADLKDGQLLLETLYVSLDPAMRGWLSTERSYIPPVAIGAIMRAGAICRVLATRSAKAAVGDIVTSFSGWTEVAVAEEATVNNLFAALPAEARSQLSMTDLMGTLGMTGLTAYFGLDKIAGPFKPTDTVVVSGAAGATGSIVAQIAKLKGAKRVIGIAGSEEKVRWLEDDLKLDVGLNYKDPDFAKKLRDAVPDFIDVYWDNVGGEILDLALSLAAPHSRYVMCGGISQYNSGNVQGPKNILKVVTQRIKLQGFIVMDYATEYERALKDLAQWLLEGKLKRSETILTGGLEVADRALLDLFEGKNKGKLLLEVKNPKDEAARL
ncbi:alcohol dehydrogenase [Grosmannia clavigera kw1407]|uniref:Dehydrogenase FUB6 n=1 Tax=Grosmannia clavigera (strain kw1407 / UAMH 11150) TaxID=655863 RepID=F0X8Z7_GROCL|nr:alcohol dehydrogenase [Grosmannia clavigera kw1407]EFX05362.1 alcohol dehydrogenase [Grosmannia clavigera kw1407]